MPKLGFKLWVRKKSKQVRKRFRSLFTSPKVNFLLAFASTVLAVYATYYSKISYELAENDKSQQQQIDTLVSILGELRIANEQMRWQTDELKKQGGHIFNLAKSSSGQLDILRLESQESLRLKGLSYNANWNKLRVTLNNMIDSDPFGKATMLRQHDLANQTNSLYQLKLELEQELNNPVLLSNNAVFLRWSGFYNQVRVHSKSLSTTMEEYNKISATDYIAREKYLSFWSDFLMPYTSDLSDKFYQFVSFVIKSLFTKVGD